MKIVFALCCAVLFGSLLAETLPPVKLSVVNTAGEKIMSKTLKYPDQLAKVIEVNVLEKLAITIDFEKISPQQVFLGLSAAEGHTEPPRTLVFTCKSRSCKLELDAKSQSSLVEALNSENEYAATLYVSSPSSSNLPVSYPIGKIKPLFSSADTSSSDFGKIKKDIVHIFRAPEKVPNALISYAFTAIVLAPWLALAVMWASMGINIKGLFSSSSQFYFGSGFIAGLLSFVGLFYLYFTVLNLFHLLAGCFFLGIPVSIIGRKALVVKASK